MDMKKWAKRDGNEILDEFKQIFNYSGDVTFVGNVDTKEVASMLSFHNLIKNDVDMKVLEKYGEIKFVKLDEMYK